MLTLFVFIFGICVLVAIVLIALLFLTLSVNGDLEDMVQQAHDREAGEQMYLIEKRQCSLIYNPVINSWGLVGGAGEIIAAGHSIRATMRRARDGDMAQRVADDFAKSEASPVNPFPQPEPIQRAGAA